MGEIRRLTDAVALLTTQQATHQQARNVFTAKKVKLDLPPAFDGNRNKLNSWLF